MGSERRRHVIVAGAGVVGATTALVLAERGLAVTLVDAAGQPAAGTSHANGGGVTPGHAEPWNGPGTLGRMWRGLGRADSPYQLAPGALPGLWRWGLAFLRHGRRDRFVVNARNGIGLGLYSLACLKDLRRRHELDYPGRTGGSIQLFFSQGERDRTLALRREVAAPGLDYRPLTAAEVLAREPALAPVADELVAGLWYPAHESGDACAFTGQVVARCRELGVDVRLETRLERIRCEDAEFRSIETDYGEIEADDCVIALGCESDRMLGPLGLRLPVYPVRGHSATLALAGDEAVPATPLLDGRGRIVTALLGDRLRIAGLADFRGFDNRVDPRRARWMLAAARRLLPRLGARLEPEQVELWSGLRPMTVDGLPLLGPAGPRGLHLNTGHGSMGWTHACGSAMIVADIVTGRAPEIALDGLRAERFGLRSPSGG